VDVRIGVTQSPRELSLELPDDADREGVKQAVVAALSGDSPVLSITDRKGREVLVPAAKLAYVELGTPDGDRRIGFGS
jgi:Protein of unknown function (DUF3107)